MEKGRLEAFSDGVLAIIITIMVLELKVPHGESLSVLVPMLPVFLSYLISYVYVGIYWNNHHHMFQASKDVSGGVLWANLHLLFWLSLIPFATGWVGEAWDGCGPTALYGFILLMAAIAYVILQNALLKLEANRAVLAPALGKDWKGKLSPVLYILGVALAYFKPWVSQLLYVAVACIWLVPDRRIEKALVSD